MAIADQLAAFRRWQNILKGEGLLAAIKMTYSFLVRRFFAYDNLYLYRVILEDELNKPEYTPRIKNFSLKIITSNKQAEELIASGFNLDWFVIGADKRLRQGAVAFCIFVEKQLVYITWLAMNTQARDAIADIPRPVDFANKEAYTGWAFRSPKQWRSSGGFTAYMHFSIVHFLRQRGFKAYNFETAKKNTIMHNTLLKRLNIKPYRQAHNIKLLWWKSWWERDIQTVR